MSIFHALIYGLVSFFALTFIISIFQVISDAREERRRRNHRCGKWTLTMLLLLAFSARAQTNLFTAPSNTTVLTAPAIPALSGIANVLVSQLVDDLPYVSNGVGGVDLAGLYNNGNPKGTGKFGLFGSLTFPTTKQLAVGIGGGTMAHHSFITPVSVTVGTTMTNLPVALGKWYAFVSDGPLYDFSGKQVGNWAASGLFKNWTINKKVNVGLKFGVFDDSIVSGIGYFGALTGTF